MRLICPNCSAQYEVPTEVIPQGGRDVQCSNCGHTWFQKHPDDDPVLAEELNQPVPDTEWAPDDADSNDVDQDYHDTGAPTRNTPDADLTDPVSEDKTPATKTAQNKVSDPPRRRELDPSVADVLREEAERETRARAAEADTLESQPDLGLDDPDEDEAARRAREARDRMALMRGAPGAAAPEAAAAAAAAASSRRELLPDIDEINQTLRSSSERRAMETPQGRAPVEDTGGGFGRGFVSVLVIAILGIALYVMAPSIAEWLPAADPALSAYVAMIDAARLWLDAKVTGLLTALDLMSSEQTPPPTES